MTTYKYFLGGTCNGSKWRDYLISKVKDFNHYNPVVEDWTPECQQEELRQRQTCDFVLYCITPKMIGAYSVAEVVDDSNKRPEKTILFVPLLDDEVAAEKHWIKSMQSVKDMVKLNGAKVVESWDELIYVIENGL